MMDVTKQETHWSECWRVHLSCAVAKVNEQRHRAERAEADHRAAQVEVGRLQQVAETLAAANGVLQAENERLQAQLNKINANPMAYAATKVGYHDVAEYYREEDADDTV